MRCAEKLLLSFAATAAAWSADPRPIIGILTLPNTAYAKSHGYSYFPASYVKWVESGGARVVPIPYDLSSVELAKLVRSINGALFTGGSASFFSPKGDLTQFAATASLIFNVSVDAFAGGETWPVWGTCLGHELISVLGAGADSSVLTGGFDSENLTLAVDWTAAATTSRVFSSVDVRNRYASGAIAMNAHTQGITPANFAASKLLSSTFTVTSTQVDRAGQEFVASQEGQNGLPIFSTQWHSEKSLFEWPIPSVEYIAHNMSAVVANHWPAAFLGSVAALNSRSFADPTVEADALIYNFSPLTGISQQFEQLYFFPASA
jgi:gamma-glutamyl hydrolase